MIRSIAGLVLCASAISCIKEPCRPGTVYVTIAFVDRWEEVDGVALKYQLDDGPSYDVQPAVTRPVGADRGSLELRVKDYAKHTELILQFAPTKQGVVVGDWRSKIGALTSYDCAVADLTVQIIRSDAGAGPDVGVGDATADLAADAGDAGWGEAMPDASSDPASDDEPDGGTDTLPDAQPDETPDVIQMVSPDLERDRPPRIDVGIDGGRYRVDTSTIDQSGRDLADAFLTADTTSLDFGSIPVGSVSAVQSFVITNLGQQPSGALALRSYSADFEVLTGLASDCVSGMTTLSPGSSCTVRIAFHPSVVGDRSSSLRYSSEGTVSLIGSGFLSAVLNVIAATYTFPDTPVGTGATLAFTVVSSSDSPTETGALTISMEGVTDFAIVANSCTASLPPGASCMVVVRFTPIAEGPRLAQLNVVSPAGTTSTMLDGFGVSQIEIVPNPAPVSPDTGFDFGQWPLGTAGQIKTYDVWARGAAQTVLTVTLTDPNLPPNFQKVADTCSTDPVKTPNPSAPVCQISVQFFPQSGTGAMWATLSVAGSAGGSDVRTLTGTSICAPACAEKCGGSDGCGSTCPDICVLPQVCGGGGTAYVCGEPPACTTATGTATWTPIPTSSPWPEPGQDYEIVHDTSRDRFVVFGSGKTWEWSPSDNQWFDRTPSTSPTQRWQPAMAYDSVRGKVVLFGGYRDDFLNDTWEWDGATGTWLQRNPSPLPPQTEGAGMAYDPVRDRIVMVPGGNVFSPTTWEWDGSNWTERSSSTGPPPYGTHTLVWDSTRQCILLIGSDEAMVWEWHPTEASWARLSFGCAPSQRGSAAVAYIQEQDRIVHFGGGYNPGTMTFYQDLWRWARDGLGWQEYVQNATWPSKRFDANFVHDVLRNRLLLFAGANESGLLNDLWELRF